MVAIDKRFWLESFECFSISGKDAKKFLNGITTGNISNFNNNDVCKTCLLTPNGVLRSLMEINFLENQLEIIILEGDTNEIRNFFDKIIFPADDLSLGETFLINRFQEVDEMNSWKINKPVFFRDDDQEYEKYVNNSNVLNSIDLKLWKINQAIPSLSNEINGRNNPLELGLKDLIDFNKGCYLGQETISKIKNVSTLKQEIRVWNTLGSVLNLNADLDDNNLYTNSNKNYKVGEITSFNTFNSQARGLATIKRKYLGIGRAFYSEIFGQIEISKSVGSTFL